MSLVLGELSTILSADDKPLEQGLKRGEERVRDAKGRYVRAAKDTGEATGRATGDGFLTKFGPMLKAGAVAAAAAAALALGAAFVNALDVEKANDRLAAQLGSTPAEAQRLGDLAGDLYAGAWGESIGEVNEALRSVTQNIDEMASASDQDIKDVTASVLDLATAFELDVGEASRAVGKLIKTGLARDATEALDLLTRGFQTGANEADDLLETVSEYSTQFRKLGLDGQTAFGLMSQGLKAGARDADTVADALKEFAIRAVDGSTAAADGYKALGLDAGKLTAQIAKGGDAAAAGLDLVLDRLRGMKDPVAREAAAVALFGTKAEDLGEALYSLDPTSAVAALGEVGGAAERMGDTLNDNAATRIESFKRTAMAQLTELAGGTLRIFDEVGDDPAVKDFLGDAGKVLDEKVIPALRSFWSWAQEKVLPVLKEIREDGLGKLREAWEIISTKVDENREELEQLGSVLKTVAEWIITNVLPVLYALYYQGFVRIAAGIGLVIDWVSFWIGAFNKAKGAVTSVVTFVGDKIEWIVSKANGLKKKLSFSGLFDGIKNAFKSALNWVIGRWNGLSFGIPEVSFLGQTIGGGRIGVPQIPYLAKGGNILREGLAVVGDAGPELVRLGRGAQVQPLGGTAAAAMQLLEVLLRGEFRISGDDLIVLIRKKIAGKGGDVQRVLGATA
jgi:hypothetical protein